MNRHCNNGSQFEAQVWLWQHKMLFFICGVLLVAGLLVSGNGL